MMTVLPSGMPSTSGPAATTTGMSRALARMAACDDGLPSRENHTSHQFEIKSGGLGGRQVSGHQDTLRGDLPSGFPGQGPQHLVGDRVTSAALSLR